MLRKVITYITYPVLIVGIVLCLVGVAYAANIDSTNIWAWGTNVGWLNFAPTHGGVTVYSDHLEGYVWAENNGWIRLGTYDAGGTHTYANDAANTYGVNNDGIGNLSGYAWGTNIGWINFNPSHSQVTIDPVSGDFDGYAWAENVGWIHFKNTTGNAYKVNTTWRGDLTGTYQNDVAAIIKDRATSPASSGGLTIANSAFLNNSGDGIIFGHNNAAFAIVTSDLGGGGTDADKRWDRIWYLDVNDEGSNGGNVTLTFDFSEAGGASSTASGTYYLLTRAGETGNFSAVSGATQSLPGGDQVTFTVNATNLGSYYTIGAESGSPLSITLKSFAATAAESGNGVVLTLALVALGAVGGALLRARRQKRRRNHVE